MMCKDNIASHNLIRSQISVWMVLFGVFGLTACSAVGPSFKRPEVQVPANWAGPTSQVQTLADKDLAHWWMIFEDPAMTSLVERAVESNLDLKLAEARIRQARDVRKIAASGFGPTVSGTGSYQRAQSPRPSGSSGKVVGSIAESQITNQYQAGFDAGWELDIFGGVRRGVEAADADLQATIETRRDVLVTLTAEVVRNYVELRTFQQRIAIAQQNLQAQERSARLTLQRFEAGFFSGLDVANAQAQVVTTASTIPLLEASAQQTIYSISILLGREPASLLEELSPSLEIPAGPPSVPAGVPSELLRRRPDIRRAEADIHAATARIGVATADLYPRFNVTGSIGFQASDLSNWFTAASRFWSFGPSVSWKLFESGRIRANIDQQEALQDQALIIFQQTVLTALQEVENALITSEKEQKHRQALTDAVSANQKAVKIAVTLYTEGQTDFLSVLEAQRSLFVSQEALVQSTGTVSTNLVALYKALGGGWEVQEKDL
jgi:multidrug efflux system outer membrane protein